MEIKSGVYCIENTINNKKYIGSSINVYKRRNRHFSELKTNKHKNSKLQNSFNKHGFSCFIFYVLELVEDVQLLIEKEQSFIDEQKPEYNINLIANSSLGVKRSEETKEKIRQANSGLKHPEWRNKIKSEAQGGDNHWTKNKEFSGESKERMKNAQLELYKKGYKSPASKKINQFTIDDVFIKTWESAKDVEMILKISRFAISHCLIGKTKTSGGFKWKYLI